MYPLKELQKSDVALADNFAGLLSLPFVTAQAKFEVTFFALFPILASDRSFNGLLDGLFLACLPLGCNELALLDCLLPPATGELCLEL